MVSKPTRQQDLQGVPVKHIPGLFLQRFGFNESEQESFSTILSCAFGILDWLLRIAVCSCFLHPLSPTSILQPSLGLIPLPKGPSFYPSEFYSCFYSCLPFSLGLLPCHAGVSSNFTATKYIPPFP